MTSVSVVICTLNQASRLKLVLRALSAQRGAAPFETIVVDDGSADATPAVIEEARRRLPLLESVRLERSVGSAGARNAGARRASGERLLFLDGDAVPSPHHVARHAHIDASDAVLAGPLWHTPFTEHIADVINGEPMPNAPDLVRAAHLREPGAFKIGEEVPFDTLIARAERGSYPHLGAIEHQADAADEIVRRHALWVTTTPQNLSMARSAFEAAGAFDMSLPFSEGWDLVLRLQDLGLELHRRPGVPIVHLYHYRALGDLDQQLRRWRAITMIAERRRHRAIVLAPLLYMRLHGHCLLPAELGPLDLPHFARLLRDFPSLDAGPFERVLTGHPLFAELAEASD